MNQAPSHGFERLGLVVLAAIVLYAGIGGIKRAAADDSVAPVRFDDPDAKALALRVHAEVRAMDKLPQFSYRVESGNGDVETMLDMEDCTLPWLKQALDEPVSKERSFRVTETLAWSGKQAFWSRSDQKNRSRFYHAYTADGTFTRGEGDDRILRFNFYKDSGQAFQGRLEAFAYLRVTPHKFWWATTASSRDTVSLAPPEKSTYQFLPREQFDGENCDVVESASRAERLWIGRQSRRLRGVLVSKLRGSIPAEPFYKSDVVEKMAGRMIASQTEYTHWAARLSEDQKALLSIAWNEKYYEQFGPSQLLRFRDYREVAPGVWIPFREDLSVTHAADTNRKRFKYTHFWLDVQEVRTDVDLTDAIEKLRPKEGDRIVDRRYGVILEYEFRSGRTERELMDMVEAARKGMKGAVIESSR